MQVPYTIQSMVSVQRSLGRTMATEISYLRTDGNDFPLQRQFTQAFDRNTGVRPESSAGCAWRLLRRQQPDDGLQRPADIAAQAVLESLFVGRELHVRQERIDAGWRPVRRTTSPPFENNQDFWDPEFDRGPSSNDLRHRLNVSAIYELPGFGEGMTNASSAAGRFPASSRCDRAKHCASRSRRASIEAGPMWLPGGLGLRRLEGHLHRYRVQLSGYELALRWCRPAPSRARRSGPAPT